MNILFVENLIYYDGPYLTLGLDCTKGKKLGPIFLSIRCFLENECFLSTEIDEKELALLKNDGIDINKIFMSHKKLWKGWFDMEGCFFMIKNNLYSLTAADREKFKGDFYFKQEELVNMK